MASAPSESHKSSPRIDYFSSLPNELLDDIFEYAYTESPPSHPLSKRLEHWFEKHLFRPIPRSSLSRFRKLHLTICSTPSKGHFVQTLQLPVTSGAGPDSSALASTIRRLLPLLPNLIKLVAPSLSTLCTAISDLIDSPSFLPLLQALETSLPDRGPDNLISLDILAQFSALPTLHQLRINDWQDSESQYILRSGTTLRPCVTRLEVQGLGADVEIVRFLLDTCPSVLHLELDSEYDEGPEFATRLPPLPSTLQSLHLHGTYRAQAPVDSILSELTQLRSLHLGKGCYSRSIFTVLQQLPLLTELHLDHGILDPAPLQSLLAGPSRLIHMKRITLDMEEGETGSRIPKPSTVPSDFDFGFESDLSQYGQLMGDWGLPGEDYGDTPNVINLGRLKSIAEDNGLTLRGNLESTVRLITDYHIEANNRAIVTAYRQKHLEILRDVGNVAVRDGVSLPPPNLDSLDILERLEIFEIDLPEQDWFVLSLKNKE